MYNLSPNPSSPVYPLYVCSLDALDPNAYAAFQASHDLRDVVDRVMGSGRGGEGEGGGKPGMKKMLSIRATLMTPVKPMLVCANMRSITEVLRKARQYHKGKKQYNTTQLARNSHFSKKNWLPRVGICNFSRTYTTSTPLGQKSSPNQCSDFIIFHDSLG